MNYLHKKNTRKEMRMNISIGDYEVDHVILYIGSDVNTLTKKTWKNIGKPELVWSLIQL